MRRILVFSLTSLLLLPAGAAIAQVSKTITGEVKTVSATIEAIETSTRELTIKLPDGTYNVVHVPRSVERFEGLKIGDKITARYYENIVLRLQAPGQKPVDTAAASTTPSAGDKPSGTMATQRTITATITAIDPSVPSITFSGPNKWTYSSRVEDRAMLAKVKVGDKVDITWTAAVLVSWGDTK